MACLTTRLQGLHKQISSQMLQPVSHIEEAMAPFVGMPANFPSITQTPPKSQYVKA
jgi:hypothetical protein